MIARHLTLHDPTVRAPICFTAPAARVAMPYYDNAMVGGHAFGSPLPQVSDDARTPFTVVVIPVDDALAVHLPMER